MKKVITYGTFDLFHKGHYNILKRAKEEGDYLIVGVTGETYDAERGKLSVQDSLPTRIENVEKTGFADQIIIEEYLGQKLFDIIKYDIDVLVIGSDWKGKFDHLSKYCEVKYLERTRNISSTQIREKTLNIYKFGIVTDNLYDKDVVLESKSVSGIHIESVFCRDAEIAERFVEKYELDQGYSDYRKFLESVDIVYIKTAQKDRKGFVEEAIRAGKHVICDAPVTLDQQEDKRLARLAGDMQVVLLNNITTLYLQSFGQLSWMAKGNFIGELVSVKCCLSRESFCEEEKASFPDLLYYPVCIVTKILGEQYKACHHKEIRNDQNEILYGIVNIVYDNAVASVEIGMDMPVEDGIFIIGTEGTISVPGDWWNLGYFKMKNRGAHKFNHYSSNFEGNGFRYLIQSLLSMVQNKRIVSQRITDEESDSILSILNMTQSD